MSSRGSYAGVVATKSAVCGWWIVQAKNLKDISGGLAALQKANDAEFLRLALLGAGVAAFDWTIAGDEITWGGAEIHLRNHDVPNRLNSGAAFLEWLDRDSRARLMALAQQPVDAESVFVIECELPSLGGREWVEIRGIRLPGPNGRAERITGIARDISEEKNAITRLSYLSSCDELTGQLNRTKLREELARLLARPDAMDNPCGYVVAAIDRLAAINDTFGFDIADEVIVAAGQRLARSLRGTDVIGRTAGNKFGIILGACDEAEIPAVAERLRAAVRSEVIETRAGPVSATISIGAVWLPQSASTSQEAMLRAVEALEQAKAMGRNGFSVYAKSARRDSSRLQMMAMADEIMAALDEQRIAVAYQPIVGAKSREPEYYECLLRLIRRDGSIVGAGEFIPAAESLGLIRLCDRRALEIAVSQLIAHPNLKLSLNVSGTTAGDNSWLQSFISYLHDNKAAARRLTVELTETAALHAFEENGGFLTKLHELGCRVAIDDFGAGYTSFRNLHAMRFDVVKIDGSYVQNLSKEPDNQIFVRTLVELAKNFGIETVAEWVDSDENADLLTKMGVDYFQGSLSDARNCRPLGPINRPCPSCNEIRRKAVNPPPGHRNPQS